MDFANHRILAAGMAWLTLASNPASADVEDEVLAVIDEFFAAMTARDAERMAAVISEDGRIYGYRESADGLQIIRPSHAAYLEGLERAETVPVERYWEPTVLVHDRLATVWTPYDFHSGGQFSHCGINNFSLLKTGDGWLITGVVFSIEIEDCEPSPLGPLGETP